MAVVVVVVGCRCRCCKSGLSLMKYSVERIFYSFFFLHGGIILWG